MRLTALTLPSHATAPVRALLRRADGQSSVELVALLPLVVVLACAAFSLLAARAAAGEAGAAAQAGAMALLQDGNPRAAARAALPVRARGRASVRVNGRRVEVTVRPRVLPPALTGLFTASATADAGPDPSP